MPNLWGYLRDLYQTYGFGDTTDFIAIKKHYFLSTHISASDSTFKILPKGPDTSIFNTYHGRAEKFSKE
jgi:putative glutathione S-transferase